MKFRTLTRDIFLRLFLLDPGGLLLLLEGGLRFPDGHLLFLEGSALLLEGPGQHSDGHLLALELSLLLLERRPNTLQLGGPRLSLLSLLLRRGPCNTPVLIVLTNHELTH